jgi:hypothetical protein
MPVVRLTAASIVLILGPGFVDQRPLFAGGEGGCLPQTNYGCITVDTTKQAYEDKYCASGDNCITCSPYSGGVCTWCNKDLDDTYNPSNPPCPIIG